MVELTATFCILFGAMFFFHELGHVVYAKWKGIYKGVVLFRVHHLSEKIPRSGWGLLPLGAAVETDLTRETLHQRIFNCLCGTLAGLPVLVVGYSFLSGFDFAALVGLYMVGYSVDLIAVFQIAAIGRRMGWDVQLAEVV